MSSKVRFIRDFADKAPFEHNKIQTIFCATSEVKQIGKCHRSTRLSVTKQQ